MIAVNEEIDLDEKPDLKNQVIATMFSKLAENEDIQKRLPEWFSILRDEIKASQDKTHNAEVKK